MEIDPRYQAFIDADEDIPSEVEMHKLKHNLMFAPALPFETEEQLALPVSVDDLSDSELNVAAKMEKDFDAGKPKLEIYRQFNKGKYDGVAHKGAKDFGKYWAIMERAMKYELQEDQDKRHEIYAKYMALYKIAHDRGNLKEGRNILDSICRLLRINGPGGGENSIIVDKDNNITITFGS